jgi:class 3 adenylate cyclase
MVLFFAAPLVDRFHGNHVEGKRAAFDFQTKMATLNRRAGQNRRMAFRVGINTGDVIVRDASLYGDDVNIAAHIREFAPQDGVAISETMWHHVKDKIAAEFTDLGEFALKNIALPYLGIFRFLPRPAGGEGPDNRLSEWQRPVFHSHP